MAHKRARCNYRNGHGILCAGQLGHNAGHMYLPATVTSGPDEGPVIGGHDFHGLCGVRAAHEGEQPTMPLRIWKASELSRIAQRRALLALEGTER